MTPQYKHLIWNRTDLTVSKGNLGVSYQNAVPPLIDESFPPAGYAGEVIPPYAVVRVLVNPVWYKNEICFPVCRPDDTSMGQQPVGLHFFNGPAPIPVGGYGRATNELPAPVLIDLTVDQEVIPYGNLGAPQSNTGAEDIGWLVGYASGSWALHPAADILNFGNGLFGFNGLKLPAFNGTNMSATTIPYVIVGQHPVGLTGKTVAPKDMSPTVAFDYSNQVFWVGGGALGFGSVTVSGG